MDIKQKQELPPLKEREIQKEKKLSPTVAAFKKEFDEESSFEKKLKATLDFMRAALSQSGTPRFRDFWEAKHVALSVFKESLNPIARSHLWSEYSELIAEAQRLKEILDEQASFAMEQIELAIKAIVKDLADYDLQVSQMSDIDFPENSEALLENKSSYITLQKEIHLLNTLASRLHALRKEVIKTEMRIRHKNKILDEITSLGDRVLPKRKELIKKISEVFLQDVTTFIDTYFSIEDQKIFLEKLKKPSLYILREEIKAFQSVAKLISLNSYTFKEARKKLSECWEILKKEDKVRKKEVSEKKVVFQENFKRVSEKLDTIEKAISDGKVPPEKVNYETNEVLSLLKSLELGRDEVKMLKDRLQRLRKAAYGMVKEKEKALVEKQLQKEKERKDNVNALILKLSETVDQIDDVSLEDLLDMKEKFAEKENAFDFEASEALQFSQLIHQFNFHIFEKQQKEILEIKDDEEMLNQLDEHIEAFDNFRDEIKGKLEEFRLEAGRSGLDFEMAMTYRELIDIQKELLDQVDKSLARVDEKLAEFE